MTRATDFTVLARIFRNAEKLSKAELNFVIERLGEISEEKFNMAPSDPAREPESYALPLDEDDDDDNEGVEENGAAA